MYAQEQCDQIAERIQASESPSRLDLSHIPIRYWYPEMLASLGIDLPEVRNLILSHTQLTVDALLQLTSSPELVRLERLDISGNSDLKTLLPVVLNTENVKGLKSFICNYIDLSECGKELGVVLSQLAELEDIELCHAKLADQTLAALLPSPRTKLKRLLLSYNKLTDGAVKHLAGTVAPVQLGELRLDNNRITSEGAAIVGSGGVFTRLRRLYLGSNAIGDCGFAALVGGGCLPDLEVLNCWYIELTDDGLENLTSSMSKRLTGLSLDSNRLTDRAALYLAGLPWPKLLELDLSHTAVTTRGLTAILCSAQLTGLRRLRMNDCEISNLPEEADYSGFQ